MEQNMGEHTQMLAELRSSVDELRQEISTLKTKVWLQQNSHGIVDGGLINVTDYK